MKKIKSGLYKINDTIIEKIEEYNYNDSLVIKWQLLNLDMEWLEIDSFDTLKEAKNYILTGR